jgi:ABC-type bacteriocin/lantibiotic exporter with double-glycine peptidase domain
MAVPFIQQMEAAECGAASLAMVMAHHGYHAPLSEVREACGVSRDGVSARGIVDAARGWGFEADAVHAEAADLPYLPTPAILHWEHRHFVVLERTGRRSVRLLDPALGRLDVPVEEAERRFSGVALLFAPGEGFAVRRRERPSLGRYRAAFMTAGPRLAQIAWASLMMQLLAIAVPAANQILIDRIVEPRLISWLLAFGAALLSCITVRAILGFVRAWLLQDVQLALDTALIGSFVNHLFRLPLSFFAQRRPGDLFQRAQSNVTLRMFVSTTSVSSLLDGMLAAAYVALMLTYEARLAAVLLLIAVARVSFLWTLRRRMRPLLAAELGAAAGEGNSLYEALSAIETIRACGAEDRMTDRWTARLVDRVNLGSRRLQREATMDQWSLLFSCCAVAAVFWIGGREVLAESMTAGVFATFLLLQQLLTGTLDSLAVAVLQLQQVYVNLARLDDVMTYPAEVTGGDLLTLRGRITFEDVSFRYGPRAALAVDGANFDIAAGEKVALVGAIGSGKSTVARLMLGLHLPSAGTVRFEGRDLSELSLDDVRRQVGVVMQETFLFDDTIATNIRLSDPAIPFEAVERAARIACLDSVIEALPHGYETRIGQNGALLSGGERQRLALARAIAADPAILLLDEATSALDLETERRVHANLRELGCTRIVIAHRMATVEDADRLFAIDRGRIAEVPRGGARA